MLRNITASIIPMDVLVVAARPEGFQRVFLRELRWHAVKINPLYLDQLRYVAPYVSAPVSAITHYAPIDRIMLWEDATRYVVYLAGPPILLPHQVGLTPGGRLRSIQDRRYTWLPSLLNAASLDEVFHPPK